jgi:hypothetical protein
LQRQRFIATLVVVLAGGVAEAGFFDLSFNDESADAWVGFRLGDDEDAGFLLGGRYLHSDEDEIDAAVPAVVAVFSGRPDVNDDVELRLGVQAYVGEAANQDVKGFAVGGAGNWTPRAWKGAYVGARLFYGPDVFSLGDTETILEWAVQGGYRINPKIRTFVEYAKLTADLKGGTEIDVVDGLSLGLGFQF